MDKRKVEEGIWRPLKASRGGIQISHLFFADDLLLFAKAGDDRVACINEALRTFSRASGQKINYHKSLMFCSPNVCEQVATKLSLDMGIPLTADLGRYLGHQLIHQGRNNSGHAKLLQRVRDKLDGWKTKCLSRAGRITLAKSVLTGMSIFHMQVQKLPTRVHKELDKAVRLCVWGSSTERRPIHLVSWDTLCKSKEEGGLGLRRSKDMNKAMLTKLAWRLLHEEDTTWSRLLRSKYAVSIDGPIEFRNRQRSSLVWQGLVWCSEVLRAGLRWRVSNGERVLFWSDNWLQHTPLLQLCLHQPHTEDLHRRVCEYWVPGRGWDWGSFSHFLQPSTLLSIASLVLQEDGGGVDRFVWLDFNGRGFSVRSAYELQQQQVVGSIWRGWKLLWRLKIQSRVRVFLWLIGQDRILTNFSR